MWYIVSFFYKESSFISNSKKNHSQCTKLIKCRVDLRNVQPINQANKCCFHWKGYLVIQYQFFSYICCRKLANWKKEINWRLLFLNCNNKKYTKEFGFLVTGWCNSMKETKNEIYNNIHTFLDQLKIQFLDVRLTWHKKWL